MSSRKFVSLGLIDTTPALFQVSAALQMSAKSLPETIMTQLTDTFQDTMSLSSKLNPVHRSSSRPIQNSRHSHMTFSILFSWMTIVVIWWFF